MEERCKGHSPGRTRRHPPGLHLGYTGQNHRPVMAAHMLLASIHDVSPLHVEAVERLRDLLAPSVGSRLSMLVVPDHWDRAPIDRDPAFRARLRAWADGGAEMLLHGFRHLDDGIHAGRWARWRATRITAGEGEFLGLDMEEALRRLEKGRRIVEDATGRPVAGFVAPAWLYGPGARAALARSEGLPLAEDHMRVWRTADGTTLARSPVVTWATRTPARLLSSLAAAAVARVALRPLPVVRVGVHPGDLTSPAVMRSAAETLATLSRGRVAGRYSNLMAPARL